MRFSPDGGCGGCWAPPLRAHGCTIHRGDAVLCARRVLTWFAVVAAAHNCLWRSQPIFGWEKFLRPFFLLSLFFPPVIPRTATIRKGRIKKKKRLLYNLPLLSNSFPPIVSRCLGRSILFFRLFYSRFFLFFWAHTILYWGGLLLRSERNLSWRSPLPDTKDRNLDWNCKTQSRMAFF